MKSKSKEGVRTKPRVHTWVVTVLSLALVVLMGSLAWYQLSNYEKGVLDVYANQQDGYVQLVLDQINLKQNRNDQEIIDEILGTLEASPNRYWTFARQDSLIFVRDVLETNRYKGFTTATYFQSESAQIFLERLNVSRVLHDTIYIENVPYIASGVEFAYEGTEYKICLLTNAETVLDYNAYLNAKINLMVLGFVLLGIVVVALVLLALLAERSRKQLWKEMDDNEALRKQVESLNLQIERGELYDADCTAFKSKAVPVILKKLEERKAWPFTIYAFRVNCPVAEAFGEIQATEKTGMLRVMNGENEVLIFRLGAGKAPKMRDGIELLGSLTVHKKPKEPLEKLYQKFIQGIKNDGKSITA